MAQRRLGADASLGREGEATDQLHILIEGWAYRYKTTRDGSRQITALILPGEAANLDALVFNRPDFGIQLLTPATVVSIPCRDAVRLSDEHTGIANGFTRLALRENAILSQWAFSLGRKAALQRLAHLLCEVSARLGGKSVGNSATFSMPLTQELIADALGLTPVHVNRTLQVLRSEGLVETHLRSITLSDIQRLRQLAEFDQAYLHRDEADQRSAGKPGRESGHKAGRLVPPEAEAMDDLLLRETRHRCSNDLQLAVSLLGVQSRRTENPEVRAALADATSRVAVLARSRAALNHGDQADLASSLRQICAALRSQAEPRGILISATVHGEVQGLSPEQVSRLALAVNELATNAIKHAFTPAQGGRIEISARQTSDGAIIIVIEDDGLAMANPASSTAEGMGGNLVKRLIASAGGSLAGPMEGSKRFEIIVSPSSCDKRGKAPRV